MLHSSTLGKAVIGFAPPRAAALRRENDRKWTRWTEKEKLLAQEREYDRYVTWLDRQREIDDAEYDRLTYRPR